jgi:formamidopyrimidine-DNA glycosylase
MPELPEVETIVRHLREGANGTPGLPGKAILDVRLDWPRHVAEPAPNLFRRRVAGQTVLDVTRRGKYLVFPLSMDTMLIHLKMSGDLVMAPAYSPPDRYQHTVFELSDDWELRFSDARKFGKIFLLDDPASRLDALGPEPLSAGFTAESLGIRLRSHRRALKPLLLDQSFVAGLGNIYVDEALHRAGLHPLRRSNELDDDEVGALWKGIRQALRTGLKHNGASLDWVYRGGDFQNHFRVYQRAGEPCPVCGTALVRIVVAQRGTHFCPTCQPERPI